MNQHGGMGISPMMQQSSPQQPQSQGSNASTGGVHTISQSQAHLNQLQQTEKLDNISKVKSLASPLRESLAVSKLNKNLLLSIFYEIIIRFVSYVWTQATLKTAAQLLQHNNLTDNGATKGIEGTTQPRFDKHLEEFYSICDQIELHLKTSIQCVEQNSASQRYLPVHVATTRVEPLPLIENGPISYPQYLSTVRTQISYAKDIHDTLICAAQNISPTE